MKSMLSNNACGSIPSSVWNQWRINLEETFKRHPLQILHWEATRRCDLRCRHCGSPKERVDLDRELSADEVVAAFSQIKSEFDLDEFQYVTITGGEPFERADLVDIIGLFHSFGWLTGIQTNGNWIARQPEKIPELIKMGVGGIGVDLDGPREDHDWLRAQGGHFDQTFELVRELMRYNPNLFVIVTTVVSRKNFSNLEKFWRETIQDLNPHRWRIIPLDNIGRSDAGKLLLGPREYEELFRFICEKRMANFGKQNAVQTELACTGWMGKQLEELRLRPYVWSCIAGRTCMGILYDGSLAGCSNIDRAFIQGNVRADNIRDVWENRYQVFRNRPEQKLCENCSEKIFCTIPMHKLASGGQLRDCIFQILEKGGENNGRV